MGQRKAQLQTELDDLTQQRKECIVRKLQLSQEMKKLDQEKVTVDNSISVLKEMIRLEERDAEEYRFTWQWLDQGGDDHGIPQRYTPCRYFFCTAGGCQRGECLFSHNPIFYEDPFHSCLQKIRWPEQMEMQTGPPWARSQKQSMEEGNKKRRRC